jgi:glycosyltransferase involved in cell wall biosynthesis
MRELSQMRICFIAGTLGQGGAERQLFYKLRTLHKSGARVKLLSLTEGEYWEEKIRALGVDVAWVGKKSSRLLRLARIIAELRQEKFDIVQSQHFYTNIYAAAAARILGLREVGAVRNDAISEVKSNGRTMGRLSLTLPRLLAANSRAAMRNAESLGVPPARLRFLPNVVDPEAFRPRDGDGSPTVRLIAVGRLSEQKRLDRFLSILSRVRKESPVAVEGVIVGEGPLGSRLEEQAAGLGLLPDGVVFKGAVKDMAEIYSQADMLVLTSDHEGTPNVVLEAMASALPVVAARVGDLHDIIHHGESGFLREPEDVDSMAGDVLGLIKNADLRKKMGSCARRQVLDGFSPERLPGLLSEIYEVALS